MSAGAIDAITYLGLGHAFAAPTTGLQARPELLYSYAHERVPVGARLLRSTGHRTFLIQRRNLLAAALPVVFSVLRNVPAPGIQRKVLAPAGDTPWGPGRIHRRGPGARSARSGLPRTSPGEPRS